MKKIFIILIIKNLDFAFLKVFNKNCGKSLELIPNIVVQLSCVKEIQQMKCIYCGAEDSKVLDSRSTEETNSIRRRRECLGCGRRFTTYETIETVPVLVVKKDGSRQAFNIEKIRAGMIKACEKRPVSIAQIDAMAEDIEKQIQNSLKQEIPSQQIGEMIMEKLKSVDEIAYVRFASVYRQFKDVTNFIKLITEM